MNSNEIFSIFFSTLGVLGIISFVIFFFEKDNIQKQKRWKPLILVLAVLFMGFVYLMGLDGEALYIMVIAIGLISFLNIRLAKFCDACGKAIIDKNLLAKPDICSMCRERQM